MAPSMIAFLTKVAVSKLCFYSFYDDKEIAPWILDAEQEFRVQGVYVLHFSHDFERDDEFDFVHLTLPRSRERIAAMTSWHTADVAP
jgi:hypothetical protein